MEHELKSVLLSLGVEWHYSTLQNSAAKEMSTRMPMWASHGFRIRILSIEWHKACTVPH